MERKKFITQIGMAFVSKPELALAKIMGIEWALCREDDDHYCHLSTCDNGDKLMIIECREEQYNHFRTVVDDMCPGMCIFNI